MSVADDRNLEKRLRGLERAVAKALVRGGGGGGGGSSAAGSLPPGQFVVPTVEALPAVPTVADRFKMVFWTSEGDGTGDDQVWWTYYGLTRWYPLTYSTLNGTPGEEE